MSISGAFTHNTRYRALDEARRFGLRGPPDQHPLGAQSVTLFVSNEPATPSLTPANSPDTRCGPATPPKPPATATTLPKLPPPPATRTSAPCRLHPRWPRNERRRSCALAAQERVRIARGSATNHRTGPLRHTNRRTSLVRARYRKFGCRSPSATRPRLPRANRHQVGDGQEAVAAQKQVPAPSTGDPERDRVLREVPTPGIRAPDAAHS
jgi:hypothetical protein